MTLMQRFNTQDKRKLSRILGTPITMEEATKQFNAWTRQNLSVPEITEYFHDLQDKLSEELIIAKRNDNEWRIRDLVRRMWWKFVKPEAVGSITEQQSSAVPVSALSPLHRVFPNETSELHYLRGFAAAVELFTQKGAQ